MSRIQIFGAAVSSYVWVVRMVCEEKRIPYDLVPAGLRSEELYAIHPFGKMPVMRHGDIRLCESKAIATYIDKAFSGPKLIPEDARGAAEVEQWVSLVNTAIDPCMIRTYVLAHLIPKGLNGQPDRAVVDGALLTMQKQIDVLDRTVAGTGYLAGDGFSLADINLLPVLHYVRQCPEGIDMVRSARSLSDYFARHSERPSFQSTMPQPHTDEETAAVRRSAEARIAEQSARVRLQNGR
jgi:glutathione S-transferase